MAGEHAAVESLDSDLKAVHEYFRAANYLSAAQIYLQENFLLDKPLEKKHIKPRLLGHWGTCPGINFLYAHLNQLIRRHGADVLFVLGPGHGFPAVQANLFLEGTLSKYYPGVKQDLKGLAKICREFSWPYGFPSHSNPGSPGVILEGGELGYALSTAYGAAMDNPDLIVTAMIGDGEAETGPTATAWHLNKLLDPKSNGTVLPVLHLNGYKISGPTIFGRMSNHELRDLFSGYGYEPHIVEVTEDDDELEAHERMMNVLELCYQAIRGIKENIPESPDEAPRFPMIVMRTPKGWTGPKELHGDKVEGNFLSHQVVAPNARSDAAEFKALNKWLQSYKFGELFDAKQGFRIDLERLVPSANLRMGDNKHVMTRHAKQLSLPSLKKFVEEPKRAGQIGSSSMRRAGMYLAEVMRLSSKDRNFRLLSPDETYSNKLDDVFDVTGRAFARKTEPWDRDLDRGGRVVEMLSEHTLQGLMQGYVLTGRHAVFASYEAFIQIVSSMVDQYAKFLRVARQIPWRPDVPSLNYILTSSGWRQEHNGFSHQNPGFIDDMLHRQGDFVNVYFPPDATTTLVVLRHALASNNEINVIVAGKTIEPRWLTLSQAEEQFRQRMMVWDWASDPDPDLVMAAAGDYLVLESMAAIDLAKKEEPGLKLRFVNIMELSALGFDDSNQRLITKDRFEELFTVEKPVIINFHGYPQTIKQFLFDYTNLRGRFSVHGYQESGSTTTPFDMQVRNGTSRYQLVIEMFERLEDAGVVAKSKAQRVILKYHDKLAAHTAYIKRHGIDPKEIEEWQWRRRSSS